MNDMNNIFNVHIPDPDHMTCECGARIKRTSLSGHRKTAKHLRWIEEHFAERIQKRLAEENLRISAENIRRQEEALRYYQKKKRTIESLDDLFRPTLSILFSRQN